MIEQQPVRDFRSLLQMLREQWKVVALIVGGLSAAVLFFDLLIASPLYRSDTEVLVRNSASELVAGRAQSDANRLMANEQSLAGSRSVTDVVEAVYGDEIEISIVIADNRDVLVISAVEETPELAQEIAAFYTNTYLDVRARATLDDLLAAGDIVGERLRDLDTQIAELDIANPQSGASRDLELLQAQRVLLVERLDQLVINSDLTTSGTGRIISPANLPDEPVSPNTVRDVTLAVAVGLILGLGAAYVLALLGDEGEEEQKQVAALGDIPVFIELPVVDEDPGLSILYRPTAPFSEALRGLRTTVRFAIPKHRVIQVASAMPNDGKTTVSANLAYALAVDGFRVLVIDADLRTRGLSEMMGLEDEKAGLATVLMQGGPPFEVPAWHDKEANVWVVAAGRSDVGPAELLGQPTFGILMNWLREEFDVVIIDSPPLLPVTDGSLIAREVDDVLLTVGQRSTADQVAKARGTLDNIGITPTGTIINAKSDGAGAYGYGYGTNVVADQPALPSHAVTRVRFRPVLLRSKPQHRQKTGTQKTGTAQKTGAVQKTGTSQKPGTTQKTAASRKAARRKGNSSSQRKK